MDGEGCLFVVVDVVDVCGVVGCCGAEDEDDDDACGSCEGGCWRKAAKKLERKGRWGDMACDEVLEPLLRGPCPWWLVRTSKGFAVYLYCCGKESGCRGGRAISEEEKGRVSKYRPTGDEWIPFSIKFRGCSSWLFLFLPVVSDCSRSSSVQERKFRNRDVDVVFEKEREGCTAKEKSVRRWCLGRWISSILFLVVDIELCKSV